ncbi:MAG: PEGA domain-containing protein, partial [Deltaproteobacteria bacterium]|nr:PEGA domain-containing protein [Deltaproteobacteria bacterium]
MAELTFASLLRVLRLGRPAALGLCAAIGLFVFTQSVAAQEASEDAPAAEDENPVAPQRVYILSTTSDAALEGVSARVGAAARAALRGVQGALWEEADRRYLGYDEATLASANAARAHLAEGRQAYLNLELETAIDLLGQSVQEFDRAAAALEDPSDLGSALLFLGAAQTFADQSRAARRVFVRVHRQFPHLAPDPNIFPPDVIERFNAARPRHADTANGQVHIESAPTGALIYVDYVARGYAPIDVGGLLDGEHVVRVLRPGATPFVQTIEVNRGRAEDVNAFLDDDPDVAGLADAVAGVRDASLDSIGAGSVLGELATLLDLDELGVIRVSAGESEDTVELEFMVFETEGGQRLLRAHGQAAVAVGRLESAVGQLVAGTMRV